MRAPLISLLTLSLLLTGACLAYGQTDAGLLQEATRQTDAIRQAGHAWPIVETRFFCIHHQPEIIPSKIARAELDRFTAETALKVGLAEAAIENLEARKLDYYLCDDKTVQAATGHPTKGMADLRGRAVISSHFPHFHELAHLLVDMTFAETPAQTLPVVQEGLACLLGGRWGRSPRVVLYTGWVNDHFGMGTLADVLTQEAWNGFGGGPDVAYPLGALLCETVRRQAGWTGVMELNRKMAGSAEKVAGLDDEAIYGHIYRICGWTENDGSLEKAMAQAMAENKRCGILPGGSWQGAGLAIAPAAFFAAGEEGPIFKVEASACPLFVLSRANPGSSASTLFQEHLPGHTYRGQRWGLRVSPEAISLYDFATNQLLGLWVAGFSEEPDACASSDGTLVFRLEESSVPPGAPGSIATP